MDSDDSLAHYGIRGMKWGVRKTQTTGPHPHTSKKDLKPNADGSVDIPKGAVIQRVVNGKRLLSKAGVDIGDQTTYASFTKGDNLRYENNFGVGKNLLVKDASRVLSLRTKVAIKAPTPGETSAIYYKSLKDNPELFKQANNYLRSSMLGDPNFLKKALDDPTSKNAYHTFGLLFDTGNYSSRLAPANKAFISALKKRGYNAILDPSDSVWGGTYDAPIAVFGGKNTLEIAAVRTVDKTSRITLRQAIQDYRKVENGKLLMQRLGYDD